MPAVEFVLKLCVTDIQRIHRTQYCPAVCGLMMTVTMKYSPSSSGNALLNNDRFTCK